jgi:membrane protease YdiL (CAAX protease family)
VTTDVRPISDPILTQPPPVPPADMAAPPRWGFWATCAWGVAALLAFYVTQTVVLVALLFWWAADPANSPADLGGLTSNAVVVATMTLACVPVTLGVLALAARLARSSFVDYFALHPIGVRTIGLALACTLAYGVLLDVITYVMGHPMLSPFVVGLYQTARESGTLWLTLVAVIIIAAPITEEFLFRGFLLRGWARSRLGVVGAVVLTSVIWAAMHIQYDWLGIAEICGLGLLFGWLRHHSGSLITTLAMHAVYSAAAMIQVAVLAG